MELYFIISLNLVILNDNYSSFLGFDLNILSKEKSLNAEPNISVNPFDTRSLIIPRVTTKPGCHAPLIILSIKFSKNERP